MSKEPAPTGEICRRLLLIGVAGLVLAGDQFTKWLVTDQLQPGDRVIVSGQSRLLEGVAVEVVSE